MKHLFKFTLILSVLFMYACGSDDGSGGGGGTTSNDISVSILETLDLGNAGNASDIRVSFNVSVFETSVDHYRVILVNSTVQSFDLAAAEALSASAYTRVDKTGSHITTRLSAQMTDSDGASIANGQSYTVFVHSIGTTGVDNRLKAASAQLDLEQASFMETIVEMPIGTGGVVVDADGNVYSADFGAALTASTGSFLYKITPEGEASVFASGFIGASGNTIGPDGNIYQSNISGGKVSKVTMDGVVTDFVTGMVGPVGVVFDSSGNLYVANCNDNTIRKVDPNGTVSVFSSGTNFSCPNGITVDDNDNLYVANFSNANVVKITPDGTSSVLLSLPGGNNGHITFFQDNLYIVARAANQIYKVGLDGQNPTVFVGSGTRGHGEGSALEAELSLPNDLGFSPDGKFLYINDAKPLSGLPANSPLSPSYLKRVTIDQN